MHPVLELLHTDIGGQVIEHEQGNHLAIGIQITKHCKEGVGCYLVPENDRIGTIDLTFYAISRYPITNPRNQKYLEHLRDYLSEANLALEVSDIRTVSISGKIDRTTFGKSCSWKKMAQGTRRLIYQMFDISTLAVLTTHLNARLPNQGGSERYQKVLPSRLAALTMCGYTDGASMH